MARRLVAILGLLLAALWGAWIRVDTTLADPNFDARDARGILRSDPALLFYLTGRVLESGGGIPPDFRADARIQHPFVTDVPAEFPVGQEFLVAWAQHWLAPEGTPLHVTALWVMSVLAASFVLGTFALVRAATKSDLWAALAALLALVTPANYRTIGFLMVGEDIALPLFALHLGWLARAVRTTRARDFLGSGALLAAALSTWHAMGFVLAIELGVLWLGCLWSARSPFELERSAWTCLPGALAGACVPVLRANGLLVSPAAALALALLGVALVRRARRLAAWPARGLALALLGLGLAASRALAPASHAHVGQVVWAKLRLLGRFPSDPATIPFDARLLWQGPFETLEPGSILAWAGWPLGVLLAAAVLAHLVGRDGRGFERFLLALALAALPAAWMFERLAVLIGLFAPGAAALALARWPRRAGALALFGVLTLAECGLFAGFVRAHRVEWYLPAVARAELAGLVEWVREGVPAGEPIAGDFVNSTALLVHTGHPIVLQPKYETDRSRRQAEAFLTTFFQGTPEDLARLLRERFDCRHLLVDRYVLWELSRATAGLRADEREPRPGTAAALLLSPEAAVLASIPGFELLYRSPSPCPWADYRVFRLR